MIFRLVLLVSLSVLPVLAIAANFPNDNRIRVLEYHENDVYVIDTLYGFQTNIEFEEGEEIQTISVGDRSPWQLIPSGRRLFIRPMDEDVATNMTIITNLRAYQFEIRAGKGTPEKNPRLIYVAKFIYPGSKNFPLVPTDTPVVLPPVTAVSPEVSGVFPAPASTPRFDPSANVVMPPPPPIVPLSNPSYVSPTPLATAPVDYVKKNYNYSFSGNDVLAPVDTYDDGFKTYIRFADAGKGAPKLYQVQSSGKKILTPYVLENGLAVATAVADKWMIDYAPGKSVVLYNEANSNMTGK